jgi:exonuclease III
MFKMKVITWNIRGLNIPEKQRIIKNKLKRKKLDICFIQETKCTMEKMAQISKKNWNIYKVLDIYSQNVVGGILTLWNPQKVELLLTEAIKHYMSVIMQVIGSPEKIMCTKVYGPQLLEYKKNDFRSRKPKGSK